jgi:hypothetical protein
MRTIPWYQPTRLLWIALVVSLAGATGCGTPKTYPVRGKVVFPDGTPLPGGFVIFEPAPDGIQVSAQGGIQPDGTFRLGTYQECDGAPEGRHRALVNPPRPANPDERRPTRPLIHPRFQNFDTSRLEYTVTRGKNEFTIVVEKP